jgi:1-acyl-sn-glycerol-3-phosphate acyltransferase
LPQWDAHAFSGREIEIEMNNKPLIKHVDRTLGALARSIIRNLIAKPLLALNYKVEIVGADDALSLTEGALVVSNHVSFLDGPFLLCEAWPYARIRVTAWHAEYSDWKQWWAMELFSAISLGSPRNPPKRWMPDAPNRGELWAAERQRRKARSVDIMGKVLAADRHLLLFCEGAIGDGRKVSIPLHLSGVHDLIEAHPDKPVLLVRIEGLEKSVFGKLRPRPPFLRLKRLPVRLTLKRVDNISLEGGPPGLNSRLEAYYNEGIPLASRTDAAA